MTSSEEPKLRNRAQRRAAARDSSKPTSSHLDQTNAPYKLAQPDRSGPKSKTLYEIAAERQAELEADGFYEKFPAPEREGHDNDFWSDEDPIGPFGEAIVYGTSLSMLHFTLDVMVFHQYRQEIEWNEIFIKTGKMLPALFFVVYLLHSRTASRFPRAKQVFFLAASTAAGCYLVRSGNMDGYYAVMKRAPPVGTLWIWGVVEMQLGFALAHIAAILAFMWWYGFGAF